MRDRGPAGGAMYRVVSRAASRHSTLAPVAKPSAIFAGQDTSDSSRRLELAAIAAAADQVGSAPGSAAASAGAAASGPP